MWTPTSDEQGRVYYDHTETSQTQWENPLRNMLKETQAFAEEVLCVSMRRSLSTAVEIGSCHRVTCCFRRWVEVTRSVFVTHVRGMFEAWLRLRECLVFSARRRLHLTEELVVEKLRSSELSRELATCRVERAQLEFERMESTHRK